MVRYFNHYFHHVNDLWSCHLFTKFTTLPRLYFNGTRQFHLSAERHVTSPVRSLTFKYQPPPPHPSLDVLSIFGLARRARVFAGGLLTFALVSGFQLVQHNRDHFHFHSAAFSSQLETTFVDLVVFFRCF